MAGHSKFKNIMYRKGAQDKKRAKVFTKLIRELTVATKSGAPDPDMNPRLRSAIAAAKARNMPSDNIKRAIEKASGGGEGDNYEDVRYEGYGPGGIAVIVEALTDNRNRTAGEVRAAFAKHGGTLGETGSVAFMFDRVGFIRYKAGVADADAMFEAARRRAPRMSKAPGKSRHSLRPGRFSTFATPWKKNTALPTPPIWTGGRKTRRPLTDRPRKPCSNCSMCWMITTMCSGRCELRRVGRHSRRSGGSPSAIFPEDREPLET